MSGPVLQDCLMARCVLFAMAVAMFAGTASATTFWGVSTRGPDGPPPYILPPEDPLPAALQKSDESMLPRPEVVTTAVKFWTRVYTEVDTNAGFIHDSRHLDVVYETINLPDNASRRTRSFERCGCGPRGSSTTFATAGTSSA